MDGHGGAADRTVSETEPLRVLIVEDADPVASLIDAALRAEGMATALAGSGAVAISQKPRFRPDVILLDLGLPDMDGLGLVKIFANDRDCGVIVVTANDAEAARIAGLDTGADDYVVKPAPLRELAARIRAVHRRLTRPEATGSNVLDNRVVVDSAHRWLVSPDGTTTPLTEAEYAALEALLEANGRSVSREWIGKIALKRPIGTDDRSVDQLVMKLRRKLVAHGVTHRSILSSRGLGYIIPEPSRFMFSGPREPREGETATRERH